MTRLRVVVLFGGRSSEHEVSQSSGAGVLSALDAGRYEVTAVEISRDGRWSAAGRPVALVVGPDGPSLCMLDDGSLAGVDVVFPVLHGPFGEDGTVQGLCETVGVACVGGGVAASAIAMDKGLFKDMMRAAGVPTVDYIVVRAGEWAGDRAAVQARVAEAIGYPAFAKPARLGSSVGISRVADEEGLGAALDLAMEHDATALVERAIVGKEVEVGLLGNDAPEASPIGEITFDAEWYDYETKYLPDRMQLVAPADLPDHQATLLVDCAVRAWHAIGCRGMARVDFFATADGQVLISELNTIPGFTPTSVYAKLFEAGGVAYSELLDRLIALARADFAERAKLRV